ncbi:AAA family ATPase [Candidatus Pacearchaeota archaeon]|nr:AAA family ATPase [Candidatus Pacearchaeota archaeon]
MFEYSSEVAVKMIRNEIVSFKEKHSPHHAMMVGIEGLSNSGKSTLASSLEKELKDYRPTIFIDGDKFHVGKKKAMEVYHSLIDKVKAGEPVPEDFPYKIWRYDEMDKQLLQEVRNFNQSYGSKKEIVLEGLLTDKKDGTEHSEKYTIDRDTIGIVPAIYLPLQFDYMVRLHVSPDVSVQRKIERALKIGDPRDPKVTREMVDLIEYPIMESHIRKYPLRHGVIADMDNFEKINLRFF